MPAPDSIFEFLFKYRKSMFEAGDLFLAQTSSLLLVLLLGGGLSLWSYRRVLARSPALRVRDAAILTSLRVVAISLLAISLAEPRLRTLTVAPQQTFVGVLVDDSLSQSIQDDDGRARGDFIRETLLDPNGDLRKALEARFKLRFFRFASGAERIDGTTLTRAGRSTDLASALQLAREDLAEVPLSGLVLATDGADNVAGPLSETLLDLRAKRVPVFTLGVGRESFERDVEIARVEMPAKALQGSSVVASVTLKAQGAGRNPLLLTVEDEGRILSTREIEPGTADGSTTRIAIRADEAGPRLLQFRIAPVLGEQVTENNRFEIPLDVVGAREKILYFEGGARFEAKFLRRAVADDRNLQVVTLERTADNRFLRLDVDDGEELAAGFPKSREELFQYRGLILGGVEASFFTVDQIRMITDFVSQRGGGLLMLGSEKSFGEGGYSGTAVAEALPVAFDAAAGRAAEADGGSDFQWVKVAVTPLGAAQPVTQLAASDDENEKRFAALPPLSSVNNVTRVKPGASTLLIAGPGEGRGEPRIALAFQRYGRGRAFAFPVQDSWRWQMHADVPADDTSHEVFWRQMLRQLVSGSGGPVTAILSSGLISPGSPLTIRADVADETFVRVNDANVVATIEKPGGELQDVPLRWTIDKDGEYAGEVRLDQRGVHRIRVNARRGDRALGEDIAHTRVGDSDAEFRSAEMKGDLLRRVAAETGGRFYTRRDVSQMPEDLSYSPKTASVVDEKELWDMPVLFLGILLALTMEWSYRKLRGLV